MAPSRPWLLATVLVAACVPDAREVRAPVDRLIYERTAIGVGDDAALRLARPLTRVDAAVIAATHNPRAAAALAELGVAAGQAGALRAPEALELDVGARLVGDDPNLDVAVTQPLDALVALGPRRAAAAATVAAARARAAAAVIGLAVDGELAWLDVAGAIAQRAAAADAFATLAAAAELTERIHAAGGTTDLAAARAASARELARLDVSRADAAIAVARAGFARALGLDGATAWSLADELPAVPPALPPLDALEATAVTASLTLAALDAEHRAATGVARAHAIGAWLPGLAIGVTAERSDTGWSVGPALRVGLPLWSAARGEAAAARGRAAVAAATRRAAEAELRAAARAARLEAEAAFAEARHLTDTVVPLTRTVVAETVRQYNAMNASPFELLTARRDQALAEQAAVAARLRLARALVVIEALERGVAVAAPAAVAATGPAAAAEAAHP